MAGSLAVIPVEPPTGRPWLAHYEPGVASYPDVHGTTLHALLASAAAGAPRLAALTYAGATRSYGELGAYAGRVAGALARDGVLPGSVVAVALPLCPALVAALYGVVAIGAVALVLPAEAGAGGCAVSEDRLADILAAHDPSIVVTSPRAEGVFRAASVSGAEPRFVMVGRAVDQPRLVRVIGAAVHRRRDIATELTWQAWLSGARAPVTWPQVGEGDPAVTLVAPGTGTAVFTHRQLLAGAAMFRSWLVDALPAEQSWLWAAHPSRAVGLVAALGAAVDLRAELVILRSLDRLEVADAISARGPAYAVADGAAPAGVTLGRGPLRAWFTTGVTGAGQPQGAAATLTRVGLAPEEAAGFVLCNPVSGPVRGVGLPLPGAAARVVDGAGNPAELGDWGLLELEAPNLARPGWVGTTLTARIDPDGFVTLAPANP